ncbi:MAG: hypothetical protein GEU82_02665 [Luteitalea sp.]|nr:hypothetical protein [Luteitalea sp.]
MAAAAQRGQAPLPLDPQRERGASVTPAYEGWYRNPDGSFTMLIGYYNRNSKETLDIPVGPNNRFAPGNPDQGQPTHFETGRQWGVFTVNAPKDFGSKALTWTIISNGETQSIPFTLNTGYTISPLKDLAMGNAPPVLAFSQGGRKFSGPPTAIAAVLTGRVKAPVTLNVWAEDPKGMGQESGAGRGRSGLPSAATVSLHKFRGPGSVTFEKDRLPVANQGDMVSTTATFSAPGSYVVRVQANDESGEGGAGFQCCWTNAHLGITIE